ncbi:MAG: LacI family DNA-binding transcriptional regulator [Micromonosporaceae bacterium]|nr:LacI family DNA-binding transcriptional regulator [Micromonosporaceae bacterium]
MKDVAAAAQVSVGTVSNVLNRPELVSPATRDRVERTMADLGFVRNESARQLRAGTSRTLAYVMLDASNPFFTDVARGIEEAADELDLSLFLCNSNSRASRESSHLARLQQQRVQGILITPVDAESEGLAEIARRGTPVVVVDRTRRDADLCSVSVDDRRGGRLAVEHLIELGHRRIAFVGGPLSIGQVRDRIDGARAAWRAANRPADALVHVPTDALTVADGTAAGARLLAQSSRRRPTAVFCANDLVALGVLRAALQAGLRVPDDVAIVGYDDIDFAAAAAIPLTSVRQPRVELGRTAARLVIDEATNVAHEHQQVVFEPDLVTRASTLGVR